MNKSLFIIPFYNEEKKIPQDEFVQSFLDFKEVDFLLVNDGSSDKTQLILDDFSSKFSNVKTIGLAQNKGKAEAIRKGILDSQKLNYSYFGYLYADLSTPISELLKLLEFSKSNSEIKL